VAAPCLRDTPQHEERRFGKQSATASATLKSLDEIERSKLFMKFKGSVCIVTGAASGLGNGIAKKLLESGATVVLLDIDKMRLNRFKTSNSDLSNRIEIRNVDVTRYEDVKTCIDGIYKQYGKIDYLFNNAGIGGTLPFEQATPQHWDKIISLNLCGVINGISAVYPLMVKQHHGYIINTSSISGLIPVSGQVLYNTTKFAVTGLSLSLFKEAKKHNINVAIICPGMVKTRIFYKPIIGEEAPDEHVKIPKEAISVDEAVNDIFIGISRKKKIIITPKYLRIYYFIYRLFGTLHY
jgi:NADP-dependent 3-hydroxy acid dehydrogenase YdfG